MAAITKQELEDAAADVKTIEDVVNGAVDINGTGEVVSRLGRVIRTLAKVDDTFNEQDIAVALAAQNAAEAARDAAFANADVYADIATGRAAVADGEQFMVVSGDTIIRYRRDSSTAQTEMASYPLADRVNRVTAAASSPLAQLSALAVAKGGVHFAIHPLLCFQERTADAATPAGLGDPVGCVRGADGTYFMLAGKDATRGFLAQDDFGNYFIDASAGATYVVEDASGVRWSPTRTWTHVIAMRGAGVMFCFDRSGANRASMGGSDYSGTDVSLNGVSGGFFQDLTAAANTVPYVVSMVKEPTEARCWWNGVRSTVDLTPVDDSALTIEAGYMMTRTLHPNIDNSNFSGRFYGSFWVPGTLSAAEMTAAQTAMNAASLPRDNTYSVDRESAILDFEAGTFEWGGSPHVLADMTDEGAGVYTLDYVGWWDQAHTIVLDLERDPDAGSWSGDFVEFIGNNTKTEKISVHTAIPNTRVAFRGPGGPQDLPFTAPYGDFSAGDRTRFAFIVKPNEFVTSWLMGAQNNGDATHFHHAAMPPSSVKLTTQATGWTLHRAAFYKGALDGQELYDALAHNSYDVHVLGDSFTVYLDPQFSEALHDLIDAGGNPEVSVTTDGVGGVAFYEPDGDGHHQRFAKTPQHWRKTLVLNDGGFEYGRGEVLVRSSIADVLAKLDHGPNKRYVILEPNPVNPVGDSRNDEWQECMGWVRDMTGSHFVETLEAMFCAYADGDAGDIADVSNGIWPDTVRVDSTHPTVAGQEIYAKAAHGAMIDLGYLPGATTLPGVPQNVTGGTGTLTWDAPADDGGHPILGYKVEQNTGSWVSVATQGSATGYTKQYIRSMTGLSAGNYRVSAITRKGTGAAVEVAVA